MSTPAVVLGDEFPDVSLTLSALRDMKFASRLSSEDATLWGEDAVAEASIRLGWLHAPATAEAVVQEATQFRQELLSRGITRILLSGMGGSSLAPGLIAAETGVHLGVLDATHPDHISRMLNGDLSDTLLVVSSKSGSTIETRSHQAAFAAACEAQGLDPAEHLAVVTDPGSPLEQDARAAGIRVFLANPNVGGRYSALTAFGIVPPVLAGADLGPIIDDALVMRDMIAADTNENPALLLGAALFAEYPERFAVVIAPPAGGSTGLGDWVEQLIAESTGKAGQGLLPLSVRPGAPETRGAVSRQMHRVWAPALPDHVLTRNELAVTVPLGAQFVLWEAATAVLGTLLGVNPFDQPDVEASKQAARELLGNGPTDPRPEVPVYEGELVKIGTPEGTTGVSLADELRGLCGALDSDAYLAIHAYVDRTASESADLVSLRDELAAELPVPVTLGFGPRFLHSTGQLHKGGPRTGVFLQLRDVPRTDCDIPGQPQGFGEVLEAQATGDAHVLRTLGRPVLELRALDPVAGYQTLTETFRMVVHGSTRDAGARS